MDAILNRILKKEGITAVQDVPTHEFPGCIVYAPGAMDAEGKMEFSDIDKMYSDKLKVICISDTHSQHKRMPADIPSGDILIHAGDFTNTGEVKDVVSYEKLVGDLLDSGKIKHAVLIAGNHDTTLDSEYYHDRGQKRFHWRVAEDTDAARKSITRSTYLLDEEIVIEGVKIYGSPWQPEFCDWAFNLVRDSPEIEAKWKAIPEDTDILVTHGPPHGHGDEVVDRQNPSMIRNEGCGKLLDVVRKIKPKFHIFGHIHEGYGVSKRKELDTVFINASICTLRYKPVNKPVVFYIDKK